MSDFSNFCGNLIFWMHKFSNICSNLKKTLQVQIASFFVTFSVMKQVEKKFESKHLGEDILGDLFGLGGQHLLPAKIPSLKVQACFFTLYRHKLIEWVTLNSPGVPL